MLKELKFVQGAVAKKDLLPAMTHFRIEGGTVRSYNGTMAISCPIPLDIDCCPKADEMVRAISKCSQETVISITPGGKLSIKSGPLRSLVPLIQGDTPHVQPDGEHFAFDGAAFLEACKLLEPFIGTDASRAFTNGVLLEGQSAYATNNTCRPILDEHPVSTEGQRAASSDPRDLTNRRTSDARAGQRQ